MSQAFLIDVEWNGSGVYVRLSGELDMASASKLDHLLDSLVNDSVAAVTLDLAALDFIDSSGLKVLIRAQRAAGASGTHLWLANGTPGVERTFEVAGVAHMFAWADGDHRPGERRTDASTDGSG